MTRLNTLYNRAVQLTNIRPTILPKLKAYLHNPDISQTTLDALRHKTSDVKGAWNHNAEAVARSPIMPFTALSPE